MRKKCVYLQSEVDGSEHNKTDAPGVPMLGVDRHRLGIDGRGVTTLVAFHGCPLRCRYCINSRCLGPADGLPRLTPQQLFARTAMDNLYFLATGGGICFGGGEPLMRMDFIREFRGLCGRSWRLTAETSLQVPRTAVEAAAVVVDDFIVDIKESSEEVYRAYTAGDARLSWGNLEWLLGAVGEGRITVRVPQIPHYNTEADTARTAARLAAMGITHVDRFTYRLPARNDDDPEKQ